MDTYLLLLRADTASSVGILSTTAESKKTQETAIEALGGELINYWAVLGRFDAALLARFPSSEAVLLWSLLTNSTGLSSEAMQLFDVDEIEKAYELADRLADLEPDAAGPSETALP